VVGRAGTDSVETRWSRPVAELTGADLVEV